MRLRITSLLLLGTVLSCGDAGTAPPSGSFLVAISGLPAGATPAVVVTGPSSYRATIDASRTLSALAPGAYTIVASDVATAGSRFTPTPATQIITVTDGTLGSATPITYAIASARLTIDVTGLPTGVAGSVTVNGPAGFLRTITTSSQLDLLDPGTYTISANDVQSASATYRPAQRSRTIVLTASATPVTTTVSYSAGTAVLAVTIAGLQTGMDAAVTVTGPGGYVRSIVGTTSLDGLAAGSYTIASSIVGSALTTYRPSASTQTVTLADGASAAATVTYAGAPLELAVQQVADGLTQPVFVTAPQGDARLFIVERVGRIRVIVNGVLLATPFLDIRSRVNNIGERGLLGMAFDPRYASNGYFYVYYVDVSGDVAVERYSSTPGSDVAGALSGLLVVVPHKGSEHHGGMIAFGPDSLLYFAPGDGGCCGDPNNNAQNTNTMLGKLLRIDVRTTPYSIPADNPFKNGGGRAEIWAIGLRSPWRFSFDAPTSSLYLGDVGQDAREEVNVVPIAQAGVNYGWRLMEGVACYNPSINCRDGKMLTSPIFDYPHSDGCSVIGGYVYRGAAIPELAGNYLFADYCRGWVKSFRVVGGNTADARTWAGITLPQVVSFGVDGFGELYLVAQSRVYRVIRKF